jgi:hypothetical protein
MERLGGGEGGCQGPIGVVKQDHGISSCTASTLDVPWKVAVVAILGCLASASILYFQATDYLQVVWERAREAEKKGNAIDVGDLPVP